MQKVDDHVREIERCNQRGGRMLTVVDLIQAGTLTVEAAAFLLAAISRSASFLVGARPGGAGKTTVMGALLNFVPPEIELVPADDRIVLRDGLNSAKPRCYICHEIGPGTYYAYLWGESLLHYFELITHRHVLATNIHADDPAGARLQICEQNRVPATHFYQLQLLVFLQVTNDSGARREITQIWEADRQSPHQLVFDHGSWNWAATRLVEPERAQRARHVLDQLLQTKWYRMPEVRSFLIEHWSEL